MLDTKAMITQVIPEKRANPEKESFSYLVPEELESQIKIGSIVEVPFGKKNVRGVVSNIIECHPEGAKRPKDLQKDNHSGDSSPVAQNDREEAVQNDRGEAAQNDRGEVAQNDNAKFKLKEVISINSQFSLPESCLNIAKWISEYYLCSLGEAISLFLPPILSRPRKQTESEIKNCESLNVKLNSEQEKIFQKLNSRLYDLNELNEEKARKDGEFSDLNNIALLHGVTGSGKTEIYLKLVEECLKLGKQIIVLVPEIMLTTQIVERFKAHFRDNICLMHSNLSKSEKFSSYQQFSTGKKQIMIGPRSALLVPVENLGLIIIDEEQEDAYKQEKNPRYHAVTLAKKIARANNAMLLLGSATPSIEDYYRAAASHSERAQRNEESLESKKYGDPSAMPQDDTANSRRLFQLKNRYHQSILPPAEVIDLKDEIKLGNFSPISEKLQKEIEQVLKNEKQAILFINRRGAATFISCRDCGNVILCPNCDIPMVYHINTGEYFLNCHHCDHKMPIPRNCPACGGYRIKYFGSGIEKIELEVKKFFPKARVKRIDSKILENKGEYEKLYRDLKEKKIDILMGTQIVAKGLDLPEVDLVGIVSADTGLNIPQYRANEKTFQILTQVSGRSGRKNNPGKTIIQTYWPEARAIKSASKHDYEGFFKEEIADRREHDYPPFKHIIRIVSEDANKMRAKKALEEVATNLASICHSERAQRSEESSEANTASDLDPSALSQADISVDCYSCESRNLKIPDQVRDDTKIGFDFIGPAPCFLSKINNKYRYQILIKTEKWPDERIRKIFLSNPYLVWDVEPTNLL